VGAATELVPVLERPVPERRKELLVEELRVVVALDRPVAELLLVMELGEVVSSLVVV